MVHFFGISGTCLLLGLVSLVIAGASIVIAMIAVFGSFDGMIFSTCERFMFSGDIDHCFKGAAVMFSRLSLCGLI